jgi:predicted DNA-binding protein with PD1-like motif
MRALVHPGPVHPRRIDSFTGQARRLAYTAEPGVSLLHGLTGPLVNAGFQAATLRFSGASVDPFRYVMPDHASDASHVAYFSAPRAPSGITKIERANATFGWHLGLPFLHCHAAWIEPDEQRRGGHILNDETILAAPVEVQAWGFDTLRIDTAEDAETNFRLFHPSGQSIRGTNGILARVRPNEDITIAVETIARAHDMPDSIVQGSVGSLTGARFTGGREVQDHATEVLVTHGSVRDGRASLDAMVVDMEGHVHQGRLLRGENPVCITFDLVLTREAG